MSPNLKLTWNEFSGTVYIYAVRYIVKAFWKFRHLRKLINDFRKLIYAERKLIYENR